jgi:hypothetical protein
VAEDIITVSYTRPSANPLQTPSRGYADNISSKPVANNVISVVPVYTASVIENLTPNLLEMTYSLSLANVIPDISAFNVQVNSAARPVSSIAISGNKVRLILSGNVKFGDVISVSYTRPAVNPLQGVSGSAAVDINTKPVTNNVADPVKINDPPVVVINNEPDIFSGFAGQLDATGTYDVNDDALTYEWTVPADVAVSSTKEARIKYLSPKVNAPEVIEFSLNVSDGLISVSKSVSINIFPYKPELSRSGMSDIEASDYESTNYPQNVLDGDFTTNWAIAGDNQFLLFQLAETFKISHLEISFLKGQKYSSAFDIYASADNVNWDPVLVQAESCDFSGDAQVFDFPADLTNKEYSFVKYIGNGNSQDDMNIISEFNIFGTATKINTVRNGVVIYPNPARGYFNIEVNEGMIFPDAVRIYDLSGKFIYENFYGFGLINVRLPSNIKSGIYIVNLCSGSVTLHAQQIIIKR